MLNMEQRVILQERVKNFFVKNPNVSKTQAIKNFVSEGIARRTAQRYVNRQLNGEALKKKLNTGRKSSWTTATRTKLKRLTNNRKGVSQRKLARKFQVDHSTICRQLQKMKIQYYKREKTPKYSESQAVKAQKISRKLVNHLYDQNCSIIMDDEKYFPLTGNQMPGNAGYYTDNKKNCPEDIRFAGKEKYPVKLMVWIAISECGMSQPYFRMHRSAAIKAPIYINECLRKRLLPFIHKHHSDFNYIFWPDLASAHYATETREWMDEFVNYVPKHLNPPNVPKARPIEDFWGILEQLVYEGDWVAKNQDQLEKRIRSCLKKIDLKILQNLMSGVKRTLRSIADDGVFSIYK